MRTEAYRARFIELLAESDAVRFGEFTLKSGRTSPYFINTGQFRTGDTVGRLGEAYAARILAGDLEGELVFGPSYKGVPLAVATAIRLSERGRNVGFAFDRKEAKDHGEGGVFVGTEPEDGMGVVIVDDVITSGASIRHSVGILRRAADVDIRGIVVAVDRQERGRGEKTTLAELEEELALPVLPIVTIREVVDYLLQHDVGGSRLVTEERKAAVEAYLDRYGVGTP